MPVVISQSLVLEDTGELGADNPIVGWQSLVTPATIAASSEDADHPASNLANPATHLRWRGEIETGTTHIDITTNSVEDVDYVAIAKHNFGSAGIVVSVEGTLDNSSPYSSPAMAELVEEHILADDSPVIFRFVPQPLATVRIVLQLAAELPEAAVVYCGKLLILPRRIWQGHTPIKYARKTRIVSGLSESGNFLGRVMIGETRESEAHLSLIDPATYREDIDPFIAAAQTRPFFFAWRPQTYPMECGFAWMMGDPRPVNAGQHGLTEITLPMQGVA
jgi:hypothetical protein